MAIYIYASCGATIWAKFGHFRGYYLGQVCFFTLFVKKHYRKGVHHIKKRVVRKNIRGYHLGQDGHIYVATNLPR